MKIYACIACPNATVTRPQSVCRSCASKRAAKTRKPRGKDGPRVTAFPTHPWAGIRKTQWEPYA